MMSKNPNVIEKSTISFKYPSRNLATQCNNLIEKIFASHILPEIDDVFKAEAIEGINLEIDSLVIDIGQIKESELERYLGEKIRIALSSKLSKSLAENYDFFGQKDFNQESASFFGEGLYFYLTRGFMPSWIHSGMGTDELMDQILFSNPGYFILLIKKIAGNKEVKKRWAFGLSNEYFDKLIQVLEPIESVWILEFRSAISPILKVNQEIPSQTQGLDRAINYFILEFISDELGSEFNRLRFSESILRQTAAHYNLEFLQLINVLINALEQQEFQRTKYQKLQKVLKEIQGDEIKQQGADVIEQLDWIQIFNTLSWEVLIQKFGKKKLLKVVSGFSELTIAQKEKINKNSIFSIFRLLEGKAFEELKMLIESVFLLNFSGDIGFEQTKRLQQVFSHWLLFKKENPFEADSRLPLLKAIIKEMSDRKQLTDSDLKPILQIAAKNKIKTALVLQGNHPYHQNAELEVEQDKSRKENQYDALSVKIRLLSYYLENGSMILAFRNTSLFELRQIFLELLEGDDSIIRESIVKSTLPDQLIKSFKALLDSNNWVIFKEYIDRNFKGFSNAFEVSPTEKMNTGTFNRKTLEFQNELLFALIYSKGNQDSSHFRYFRTKAHWDLLLKNFENPSAKKVFKEQIQFFVENQIRNSLLGWKVKPRLVDLYWYQRIWNLSILTTSPHLIKRYLKRKKLQFSLPINTFLIIPPKSRWLFESMIGEKLELRPFYLELKTMVGLANSDRQDFSSTLEILRFWLDKGFLPWWSSLKSIQEVILSFDKKEIENDKKKLEALRIVFADKSSLEKIKIEIPTIHLPEVKRKLIHVLGAEYFKSGFLSEKNLEVKYKRVSISEKPFEKTLPEDWLKDYFRDKRLLEKTVYQNDDETLIRKFFGDIEKIREKVEVLLKFSHHIYFGNLNSSKWRMMVFEFAIEFQISSMSLDPKKFFSGFLDFIQRKYAVFNWTKIFKSLYREILEKKLQVKIPVEIEETYHLNSGQISDSKDKEVMTTGLKAKIYNSGLILTWPFLTMLFTRLGMLEGNRFKDEKLQNRAVFLLQYLAFGDVDFPEYDLVLNKLLVGMPSHVHLEPGIILTEDEKNLSDSLLMGMLQNWEKLNTSTVEALQITFLQRAGELVFEESQIILNVENKGLDVLMDSISWNIKMVKLPWMEKPIIINWRK